VDDPHRDVGAPAFTFSPDPDCDDAGLLRRIGQGDEDAMAAFYREHGRIVFAQVLVVIDDRVMAEEIVQDTMLVVWRGAGAFRIYKHVDFSMVRQGRGARPCGRPPEPLKYRGHPKIYAIVEFLQ
jgi:RNA polymerase sigma-70 factor (ECF subfamily)